MSTLRKVTMIATRRFLASESGMETMLWLRENAPSAARGDADSMIFDLGRIVGYKECLDRMAEITPVDPVKDSSEDNPSLQ